MNRRLRQYLLFLYCDVLNIEINNKSKCNCIKGFYLKSFIEQFGVMVLLNYFEFENYEFEFGQ